MNKLDAIVFDTNMKRIANCFGSNHFPAERVALIWSNSRQLYAREFEKICDYFIATFRKAPLVTDFNDAVKAEIKARYGAYGHDSASDFSKPKCVNCYDSGLRYVFNPEDNITIFMLCNCSKGDMDYEFIPRWNRQAEQLFKPIDFKVVS